jgi:hypothetical protein
MVAGTAVRYKIEKNCFYHFFLKSEYIQSPHLALASGLPTKLALSSAQPTKLALHV